jgi:hypothetical protein
MFARGDRTARRKSQPVGRFPSAPDSGFFGFVKMGKVRSPDRENTTEKRAQEEGALEGFGA